MNAKNEKVNLLLCVNEEIIIPVVSDAFKISQSPKKKLDMYIGSFILSPNGNIKKIENIRHKVFFGNSFF